MEIRLIASALGFGLILSSCASSLPQKVEISAKPIEKPKLVLPNADAVNMRKVEWMLITPQNFNKEISNLEKKGRPVVFFSISDKGYENLGLNLSDIRSLVQQQQTIIVAYKSYYEASQKAIDEANYEIEKINKAAQVQEPSKWKFWK